MEIKEEKLSDEEDNVMSKATSSKGHKNDDTDDWTESSSEDEDEDEESRLPVLNRKIKKEKKSSSSSKSEESSDEETPKTSIQPLKIKKEKGSEAPKLQTTFIPRPIKAEPESDVENKSKFKKPSASQIPTLTRKRKRESSISEHLDSLVDDLLNTSGTTSTGKKSKKSKHNESIDQTFGSPAMSSTLMPNSKGKLSINKNLFETPLPPSKIKQEPQSEDESVKRKKSKKSLDNRKSLQSIQSDLFDSFLK